MRAASRGVREREGGPWHVLHAPVHDRRDAGMAQRGGPGRDREIVFGGVRGLGQVGAQDLEGDAAARRRLTRSIEAGEPRSADPGFDPEAAEAVAEIQVHNVGAEKKASVDCTTRAPRAALAETIVEDGEDCSVQEV